MLQKTPQSDAATYGFPAYRAAVSVTEATVHIYQAIQALKNVSDSGLTITALSACAATLGEEGDNLRACIAPTAVTEDQDEQNSPVSGGPHNV